MLASKQNRIFNFITAHHFLFSKPKYILWCIDLLATWTFKRGFLNVCTYTRLTPSLQRNPTNIRIRFISLETSFRGTFLSLIARAHSPSYMITVRQLYVGQTDNPLLRWHYLRHYYCPARVKAISHGINIDAVYRRIVYTLMIVAATGQRDNSTVLTVAETITARCRHCINELWISRESRVIPGTRQSRDVMFQKRNIRSMVILAYYIYNYPIIYKTLFSSIRW